MTLAIVQMSCMQIAPSPLQVLQFSGRWSRRGGQKHVEAVHGRHYGPTPRPLGRNPRFIPVRPIAALLRADDVAEGVSAAYVGLSEGRITRCVCKCQPTAASNDEDRSWKCIRIQPVHPQVNQG